MLEEFGGRKLRRHVREIQLAPVLDLLVVVIFFLILSSSFIEFTKQTVPPSGVTTITDPVAPPPVAPKFFAVHKDGNLRMFLKWSGADPGQSEKVVHLKSEEEAQSLDIQNQAADLVTVFKSKFPHEASIQLGVGPDVNYQQLVSIMDGVRSQIQDLVLISDHEAVEMDRGTAKTE